MFKHILKNKTFNNKLKLLDKILAESKKLRIFSPRDIIELEESLHSLHKKTEKMKQSMIDYGPDISIRIFIESRILRPDIDEYQPTFMKEHLCPFCEKENFQYKEIKNDDTFIRADIAYQEPALFSSFHICAECNTIAQNIEWEKFTIEKQLDLGVDSTRYVNNFRLTEYIHKGVLEGGIGWAQNEMKSTSCFFCRDNISIAVEPWETLLVPVGIQDHGGVVHSCEACSNAYGKLNNRHYLFVDECIKCNQEYPITEEEYSKRVQNKNQKKCICPKCFEYIYGTSIYDKTIVPTICSDCGISTMVDRREHAIYIINEDITPCVDCKIKEDFIIVRHRGKPMLYWMGIAKEMDNTFMIEVYKCSTKGKFGDSAAVYTDRGFTDAYEATEKGLKALDAYYNPLKLKI